MSLNQAFQTAVAYRQGMIEQNQAAAAQAPMLAIQALGVGLQAQAQSQQAQFQMQSMVLQTQLQIEETKAKQAMQVMEFDLKQRQISAEQLIARQNYDLNLKRTNAAVAASDAQSQAAQIELANARAGQDANNALGVAMANGMTMDDLVRGKGTEYLAPLQQSNPLAFAQLGKLIGQEKEKQIAGLSASVFDLNLKVADAMGNSRLSPGERAIAMQAVSPLLKQQAGKLSELTGRSIQTIGDSSIADKLAAFKMGAPAMDPKDGVAILAEVRARREAIGPRTPETEAAHRELDTLDQTTYERMGMSTPPETNPKDPVGDELNAPVTPKIEWGGNPDVAVRNAKQGAATEAWNSFEKSKVAEGIMPVLTAARSQAAAAGDTARVAEVDRLKLALDASKAATLRGITGSDFWRSSGPVERGLTAEEARDRFMTAYRFQSEVPRVGGMSQRQMEAFPAKPTYAQVKELLESLEVKR